MPDVRRSRHARVMTFHLALPVDDLAPARGIAIGVCIAAAMWDVAIFVAKTFFCS